MEWNQEKQFHKKYLGLKEQCHEDNLGMKINQMKAEIRNCHHEFGKKKYSSVNMRFS